MLQKKSSYTSKRKGKLVSVSGQVSFPPTDRLNGYYVRPGRWLDYGATPVPGGINFTISSLGATAVWLILFHRKEREPFVELPFPEHYKVGSTYSMIVFGLDIEDIEYAYRIDGPYDPQEGNLFDRKNLLLDPYAKAVAGQRIWGSSECGYPYRARVVSHDFDWGTCLQPHIPMTDLVIYEMHVRGFTRHASSGVRFPGTFAGVMEKIPYLKQLGVNAIELMPIFEFDETRDMREHDGKKLVDYWGYNPICFFAPNTSYAATDEYNHEGDELKSLIRALHENGMEIILDVVFNHTAEGNEFGSSFSFKGLDNSVYYMLTPDGKYYNFSGCGNTLNCNHPIVHHMILECLRYWVSEYRVDGFRFDLASILGRNEDGSPMNNPPLLESLAFDPVLANCKLIAEAWDAGGLYQVGCFPSRGNRWSEWNGRYRDDLRCFIKGDSGLAKAAAQRVTGSVDLYHPDSRGEGASVNFITCHDGFTLNDLFSYNVKHNEANGWNNTDGENNNNSWNCGVEGATDNQEVLDLRRRMTKNACAILMCSRGTPMFLAGDEFGNTQFGNNNAYCQDNEISWLDWSLLEQNRDLFEFFRYMIHFREQHPILRGSTGKPLCQFPEISVHSMNPWDDKFDWNSRVVGVTFAGRSNDDTTDDFVHIIMNAHWDSHPVRLPELPGHLRWKIAVNTMYAHPHDCIDDVDKMPQVEDWVWMAPRSVVVCIGVE